MEFSTGVKRKVLILQDRATAIYCNTFKERQVESSSHIIIHQTHYEKSDWSRAFNQFTVACELDMINVISAADITFIM